MVADLDREKHEDSSRHESQQRPKRLRHAPGSRKEQAGIDGNTGDDPEYYVGSWTIQWTSPCEYVPATWTKTAVDTSRPTATGRSRRSTSSVKTSPKGVRSVILMRAPGTRPISKR